MDITAESVKRQDGQTLLAAHKELHELYSEKGADKKALEEKHELVAGTMRTRGLIHAPQGELDERATPMRGFYLVPPHGALIWKGKKTAIVKPRRFDLEGETFVLCSEGNAYGYVRFGPAEKVAGKNFDGRFEAHRVTATEHKRWWPGAEWLWLYDIRDFRKFKEPKPVEVEPGTGTFIQQVDYKRLAAEALLERLKAQVPADALLVEGFAWIVGEGNEVEVLYQLDSKDGQFALDTVGVTEAVANIVLQDTKMKLSHKWRAEEPEGQVPVVADLVLRWRTKAMPYTKDNPPKRISGLPGHAQGIWIAAYNSAIKQYDGETRANKVAWAAVTKAGYEKGEDDRWHKKDVKVITKTDGGESFPSSAYLYVPDKEKPSTWKLRIEETLGKVTVKQLGRAAAALGPGFRGRRVELPADDRQAAAKKLIGKYRGMDVADADILEYLWGIAGMEKPGKKAISLQAEIDEITGAFRKQFPSVTIPSVIGDYWIRDPYEDHVVIEANGKLYEVPYTKTGEDIQFSPIDEWTEVETIYAPKTISEWTEELGDDYKAFLDHVAETERLTGEEVGLLALSELADLVEGWKQIEEAGKAGRRLGADKLGILKALKEKFGKVLEELSKLVGWGDYEDRQETMPDDWASVVGGSKTGFKAFMGADGQRRWMSWAASAFRDKEGEIFKTLALERYVAEAYKKNDHGKLWFYHLPIPLGDADLSAVIGRILVKAGTWADTPMARKAFDYFSQSPDGWGASVGYKYRAADRMDGEYDWLWVFETSPVSKDKAAFPFSRFDSWEVKMSKLSEDQKAKLEEVFGANWQELIGTVESASKEMESKFDYKAIVDLVDKTGASPVQLLELALGMEGENATSLIEKAIKALADDDSTADRKEEPPAAQIEIEGLTELVEAVKMQGKAIEELQTKLDQGDEERAAKKVKKAPPIVAYKASIVELLDDEKGEKGTPTGTNVITDWAAGTPLGPRGG